MLARATELPTEQRKLSRASAIILASQWANEEPRHDARADTLLGLGTEQVATVYEHQLKKQRRGRVNQTSRKETLLKGQGRSHG